MGLLNVIKLANDYNKAKKLLKSKKAEAIKIKELIDKLHDFIAELEDAKEGINNFIFKVKDTMKELSNKIKEVK